MSLKMAAAMISFLLKGIAAIDGVTDTVTTCNLNDCIIIRLIVVHCNVKLRNDFTIRKLDNRHLSNFFPMKRYITKKLKSWSRLFQWFKL